MRAPDLNFGSHDHELAKDYVLASCETALGVKLERKEHMLVNPTSGVSYSICLTAGVVDNVISLAIETKTGTPLFGGQSSWIGAIDPASSKMYLLSLTDLIGYYNQAANNGGSFQGLKLEYGREWKSGEQVGQFALCHINMGWAEVSKLLKKVASLDKGGETFLYYRGSKLRKPERFCHLHVHSYYSLLDGVASPEELAETVYLNGQPGAALTDHGSMMGTYKWWQACREYEIKPMMGCEVYVVDDVSRKYVDNKGNTRRWEYHQTLIAMNDEGWENLNEIVSGASRDNYYYVPRTDHATIFKHKAGIICLSGCFKGMVAHHLSQFPPEVTLDCPWMSYNPQWAEQVMRTYHAEFGDRYYAEVHANDFPRYMDAMPRVCELADRLRIPKVIANDAHFTVERDAIVQRLFSRINSSKVDELGDGANVKSPYYLKCHSEIQHPLFTPDMYERTCEIMDRCTLSFDHKGYLFPAYDMQADVDWGGYQRSRTPVAATAGGMHPNSLKAYAEERDNLSDRAQEILANVRVHGSGTDREIMNRMGFDEPNQVRPRITELVQQGLLKELGAAICPVTKKTVRIVGA